MIGVAEYCAGIVVVGLILLLILAVLWPPPQCPQCNGRMVRYRLGWPEDRFVSRCTICGYRKEGR